MSEPTEKSLSEMTNSLSLSEAEDEAGIGGPVPSRDNATTESHSTTSSNQDNKSFERMLDWNTGHFDAARKFYRKSKYVLKEYIETYQPVIVKLNELAGTLESDFKTFASQFKYDVLALSHPCGENVKMERASAILVRAESNVDGRFQTSIERTDDRKYSIAGVHDTVNDIHHVSLYIHHLESTTEKDKKEESRKGNFGAAIEIIKTEIYKYIKNRNKGNGKPNKKKLFANLKIVISGDFNLNFDIVGGVCRDKEGSSLVLRDKLFYQWHTRVTTSTTNYSTTYTKIDYVLASPAVFVLTHKPIENDFDHFTIVSDIFYDDPKYLTRFCTDSSCALKCTEDIRRGLTMPEIEVSDKLDALVTEFYKRWSTDQTLYTVNEHYANWSDHVCNLFTAPLPNRIFRLLLVNCLGKKLFGDTYKFSLLTNFYYNRLSWLIAVVIHLKYDDVRTADEITDELIETIANQFETGKNNDNRTKSAKNSPAASTPTSRQSKPALPSPAPDQSHTTPIKGRRAKKNELASTSNSEASTSSNPPSPANKTPTSSRKKKGN